MYNGKHSLKFCLPDGTSEVNTWTDWFLIPTSRPTMVVPGVQNRFIEIDGMNGSYDATDYLTSDPVFSDRSGSFEFLVDNDHASWVTIWQIIEEYLNGKRLRMFLMDDPEWYYEGRITLNEFRSDPKNSRIVMNYRVAPFKISIYTDFTSDILWDPFCFERDMDWSVYWNIPLSNSTLTLPVEANGVKTNLVARLISGDSVTATFGGESKTLNLIGAVITLGTIERTGRQNVTLSGTGVVDIGWRKISL